MMEPYNKITDPLISQMSSDEDSSFNIPVDRTINDLRENIEKNYSDILNIDFDNAFPRMSWQAAMDNYGTDRPDTRYQML